MNHAAAFQAVIGQVFYWSRARVLQVLLMTSRWTGFRSGPPANESSQWNEVVRLRAWPGSLTPHFYPLTDSGHRTGWLF